MEKLYFISGLPRTGSSLLTAILSENKDILSEGSSGLLELMWQNQILFNENENIINSLKYTKKQYLKDEFLKQIHKTYYNNKKEKIIFDKNRNWTNPYNFQMIKDYIDLNPKVIVLLRPIKEIFESFYYLSKKNDELDKFEYRLLGKPNPFVLPFENLKTALINKDKSFLYITYKDLISKPEETIKKIYEFCQINYYNHNFKNIKNKYPEGDYNIKGLHDVRNKIKERNKNIILPEKYVELAKNMQKELDFILEGVGLGDIWK